MQRLGWTALAAAVLLVGTSKARAQDTIRLGGTGDAKVQSLVYDGDADTEQVYWRGGWGRGYGGFYRGYGYRGFYRPFAYRPFVYRPFAYRPYRAYYGYGYGLPYASYYTPSYYYGSPAYSYYADPCAADTQAMPNAVVLGSSNYAQTPLFQTPTRLPAPSVRELATPERGDGTFNYDGGPGQPMPLPAPDGPAPAIQQKRPTVPLDGKLVSIPSSRPAGSGYAYPAYGETPRLPSPAANVPPVRVAAVPTTVRVAYPAYGDR